MTEIENEKEEVLKVDFSYDLRRGYINTAFLYMTAMSTLILIITVLMPLNRRIKSMIANIINWKFTYYGMELSIYSCIIIFLKFLGFCFCCKLLLKQLSKCKKFNSLQQHHWLMNHFLLGSSSIKTSVWLIQNFGWLLLT